MFTISQLKIIAGLLGLLAFITIILDKHITLTENDDVIPINRLNVKTKCVFIEVFAATIIFSIALIFQTAAIYYGAYDNIEQNQTIPDIAKNIKHGYVESTLPDDLSGQLLIFFKYGCPDCAAIRDELNQYIKDNNIDVYYVSSRSKKGRELVSKYKVLEVPSVVYVRSKESDISEMLTEVIYQRSGPKCLFLSDKMDYVRDAQIEGR